MDWFQEGIAYHIYPLGFCGAEHERQEWKNRTDSPVQRLSKIAEWIPHMQRLGITVLYLGPLFESVAHGYDTINYRNVDPRLGTNEDLKQLINALHAVGIRVLLDGVFYHVGREHPWFLDVQANRENSPFCAYFSGIDFGGDSPHNDGFAYEAWNGAFDLVRLNLENPAVRDHLFDAIRFWQAEFGIDGLRLDAADSLPWFFMEELRQVAESLAPDFVLLGEVIHGNYQEYVGPKRLHSVTNYELFKGLYSSHNDHNYYEIAHSLQREFGDGGIYKGLPLYSFADNHDVNRVASLLHDRAHLFVLYTLLFTAPGIPSMYYGSEWAWEGEKNHNDWPLRPDANADKPRNEALAAYIEELAAVRKGSVALRRGEYRQYSVSTDGEQFVFGRNTAEETVVVAVNCSANDLSVSIPEGSYEDMFSGERIEHCNEIAITGYGSRILRAV